MDRTDNQTQANGTGETDGDERARRRGDAFDYVIVGSGAAGSVLAHRLTEEPGATVCVLEAGPPDRHPYIHVPAGFIKMLFNPDFTWQFKTEPSEGSGGRPIPTTQGRTLGGSSSINGMIYNRGQRADLDSWAQRGNRGWGYVDMLPYYKRTERRIGIADDRIHGREGNLPVTDIDWIHPICEAFIDGAVGMRASRAARTTTAATTRRASATSSAPSIAAGGIPPRACSCIRRRRPAGSRSAPMRAPPRCCSTASARSACATSNDRDRSDAACGARRGAR